MKRAFLFGAVALASIGGAIAANATTITFDSFGGACPLYSVPPGETLYTDFSSGNPGTGTGTLYIPSGQSQSGDQPGSFVAAPYTATGSATGQFFATTPGETETFTFARPVEAVGVYIGSLDADNVIIITTASMRPSIRALSSPPFPAPASLATARRRSRARRQTDVLPSLTAPRT
jgi:hypothetical protein